MPEPAGALSWACDCLFLWNIYLFPLTFVFGFSVHLLTHLPCYFRNSQKQVPHLCPPVPSWCPGQVQGGQDLVTGTIHSSQPCFLPYKGVQHVGRKRVIIAEMGLQLFC